MIELTIVQPRVTAVVNWEIRMGEQMRMPVSPGSSLVWHLGGARGQKRTKHRVLIHCDRASMLAIQTPTSYYARLAAVAQDVVLRSGRGGGT